MDFLKSSFNKIVNKGYEPNECERCQKKFSLTLFDSFKYNFNETKTELRNINVQFVIEQFAALAKKENQLYH